MTMLFAAPPLDLKVWANFRRNPEQLRPDNFAEVKDQIELGDDDCRQRVMVTNIDHYHRPATPLPKLQLFLLLWVQLAEPIISTVILPFINELIISVGITHGDDRATGHYVGVIESIFFTFETLTVLHWGRMSDKFGRRPILMIGATGLTVSTLCFGMSRTFPLLIISRSICGALNGNVGVVKAMMSEITDPSNVDQAVSFLPVVWASGSTLGPLIGGSFAKPNERFPGVFHSEFWQRHPYFLSCAVAALFPLSALCLIGLFLKETAHSRVKFNLGSLKHKGSGNRSSRNEQDLSDPLVNIPLLSSQDDQSEFSTDPTAVQEDELATSSLRDLLTYPVLVVMLNYGCLALIDIAYIAILAIFFASKPSAGGLGLSPISMGVMLGLQGCISGVFQVTCFKHIKRVLGAKLVYQMGIACFFIVFTAFPVMHWAVANASAEGGFGSFTPLVWFVLVLQQACTIITAMCYSCIFVFIFAAAPSPSAMGSTNGLAQTVSSFMRAIGPISATSLFAVSVERNLMGGRLVYFILLLLTSMSLVASSLLPNDSRKRRTMLYG